MLDGKDPEISPNAPHPDFLRGARWQAIVVKVGGFSNISVIPQSVWPEMDAMERCLLRNQLKEIREPVSSHSYVALIGGRPMRVIFFSKRGIRFTVFLIDTGESRTVRELFELPEEFNPDHVPSFAKRVSLCSDHQVHRMNFLEFRTLLEITCPFVDIIVTKSGDPGSSENTPEVLFLDEFCMDLVESHGLSGLACPTQPKETTL